MFLVNTMQITAIDFIFVCIGFVFLLLYFFRPVFVKNRSKPIRPVPNVKKDGISSVVQQRGLKVAIFYGSQTRTAEHFAVELNCTLHSSGLQCLTLNLADFSGIEFQKLCSISDFVTVFVVSTYGEGDPPDDAQQFVHWLEQDDMELRNLRYAVFGLGNSMYTYYNACAKLIDRNLQKRGAKRFLPLGLGDELAGLESTFLDWQTKLVDRLIEHFCLRVETQSNQIPLTRIYESIPVGYRLLKKTKLYIGEPKILGSFDKQIPPFDAANPFLAPVRSNQELHSSGTRSCRHIELDLSGSGLRYETGDHVAVLPQNLDPLVERLGVLLGIDLDHSISLLAVDPLNPRQQPFPCPCTYRTAFKHYVDITGPPRMNLLQVASRYATDPGEREKLSLLGSNTLSGREQYYKWIVAERRSIVDILEEFKSLKFPADVLLERLSRLKPRLYSISSSAKVYPNTIHVTCGVVLEKTPKGRYFRGLVSNSLANVSPKLNESKPSRIPIYIRSSRFHLPKSPSIPIIMIATGTGLAPFRAFIQERCARGEQAGPLGTMMLFFGCRHHSEDYIYADELEAAQRSGQLKLIVAFSRDSPDGSKVYVQDHIRNLADDVWQLLDQRYAHIYVCGSAQTMARDVHTCLVELVQTRGSFSVDAAEVYLNRLRTEGRYHLDVWS